MTPKKRKVVAPPRKRPRARRPAETETPLTEHYLRCLTVALESTCRASLGPDTTDHEVADLFAKLMVRAAARYANGYIPSDTFFRRTEHAFITCTAEVLRAGL